MCYDATVPTTTMNTPTTPTPPTNPAVTAINRAIEMLDALEATGEMDLHRGYYIKRSASATRTALRRIRKRTNLKAWMEVGDAYLHLQDAFSQPFSEGKTLRAWAKGSLLDARAALLAA